MIYLNIAVVAQLLLKDFVEFKTNKYYISAVPHSDVAAVTDINDDTHSTSCHDDSQATALDPLLVKVSNIPHGYSEQMVQMILENKRYGGGAVKHMEFSQSEHNAVVEYEERAGKCSEHLLLSWLHRQYCWCLFCLSVLRLLFLILFKI